MSTAQVPIIRPAQTAAPRPAHPAEAPRRRFVIVPSRAQRRRRPKVLHAVVAVAGMLVIVGAQLLISIAVSGGAYSISGLQNQQRTLQRQSVSLEEQVQVRASTQYLAQAAAALGMIPAANQFYLDLTNGSVTQAPGVSDPWGCGGACNLATNTLIAGLPLPTPPGQTAPTDAAAPDATAPDAGVVASGPTAVGDPADAPSAPPVDPNAPVAAEQLLGVVTH